MAWLRDGQPARAAGACRRVLDERPDDGAALEILGAALEAAGEHDEAAQAFERLTQSQPGVARHWGNLGTALRSAGRYESALSAYEQAAALGDTSPDFLLNLALLHIDRLEFDQARALLVHAVEAAPGDPAIRVFLAVAAFEQADDETVRAALDGLDTAGLDADLVSRAASVLMQAGGHSQAEALLRAQLARSPGDRGAAIRLAQVLERTNRVDEARTRLASMRADPPLEGEAAEDFAAITARLHERAGDWRAAIEGYRRLLAASRAPHLEFHVRFPLARALDAAGERDAAFAEFERAHASQADFLARSAGHILRPGRLAFSIADHPSDPRDIAGWNHDGAPGFERSPVFVVGFPRSGTTLLEQMLDAHPQLCAMDEQPFLQNAIDALRADGVDYPSAMAAVPPSALESARSLYFERAAGAAPARGARRLVDKNPLNLLRLPGIARLFPHARIMLAVRHPCDVILSCHQQHFRAPEFASLCRDLPTLAQAYVRAFDFWFAEAAKLAPAVHVVRYETLVADFSAQARDVTAFLGLEWSDALLDPARRAKARGYISTPSYAQVTQPVTAKAVGRWQQYRKNFESALPILQPYLDRWGYAT